METPAIYNKETAVQADDETGLYRALTVLLLQFASHCCLCRNTHFIYKCRGGPTEEHSADIRPVTVNRSLSRCHSRLDSVLSFVVATRRVSFDVRSG
jgi:hypothetical protein